MRTFWYAGWLLLTGIVLFACQSGDLTIGQSVINPQTLVVQSIDSITIQTSTVLRADSFATSNDADVLIGRWNDPQTGRLTAKAFASFDYAANSFLSQTNLRVDSLVLEMNYSFVYGDTTSLFNMGVYRLKNTVFNTAGTTFYNTSSVDYEASPIAQMTVLPRPLSRGKQIRFRLNNTLAQSFYDGLTNGQISNTPTLAQFLPGFAFVNNSTNNTLAGFSATTSGLRLYYHTVEAAQTSVSLLFPITSFHFSQLHNDRSGTPLSALKTRTDAVSSRLTDNTTFVSFSAQLQTRIEFPYLGQFTTPEGYADLNKALLVIGPVRRNLLDNTPPPSELDLYQVNNQNMAIATIPGGTVPQAGATALYSYDPTAQLFTDTYTFDLTYYIGQILKRKASNEPLLLTLPGATSAAPYTLKRFVQRVTLGNQFRTGDQMQLRLFISTGT